MVWGYLFHDRSKAKGLTFFYRPRSLNCLGQTSTAISGEMIYVKYIREVCISFEEETSLIKVVIKGVMSCFTLLQAIFKRAKISLLPRHKNINYTQQIYLTFTNVLNNFERFYLPCVTRSFNW